MSGIDSPDSYLLSETKTKSVFTVPVNEKTERNEPSPPFLFGRSVPSVPKLTL